MKVPKRTCSTPHRWCSSDPENCGTRGHTGPLMLIGDACTVNLPMVGCVHADVSVKTSLPRNKRKHSTINAKHGIRKLLNTVRVKRNMVVNINSGQNISNKLQKHSPEIKMKHRYNLRPRKHKKDTFDIKIKHSYNLRSTKRKDTIDNINTKYILKKNLAPTLSTKRKISDSCNLTQKQQKILRLDHKTPKLKIPNTLTIHGLHKVTSKWKFINFCKTNKIPITYDSITYFKRYGYKSSNFDSRKIKISFKNTNTTKYICDSLETIRRITQCHSNFTVSLEYRKFSDPQSKNPNPFSLLSSPTDDTSNKNKYGNNLATHVNNTEQNVITDVVNTCFATWNIQSLHRKQTEIMDFIRTHCIQILVVTETRWNGDHLNLTDEYHWFGRTTTNNHDGVGLIVHESVIENKIVHKINGKSKNSLFLHIKGNNKIRDTLICGLYAPTNIRKDALVTWWQGVQDDINTLKSNSEKHFDIIIAGDFNARIGIPQNNEETYCLGKYGEDVRDTGGKIVVDFIKQNNLICLNNRKKPVAGSTNYTYHQQGRVHHKSIIDLILISETMFRREYYAKVLQRTLTSKESHFPILTSVRLSRKIVRHRQNGTVYKWNKDNMRNTDKMESFIKLRDTLLLKVQKNIPISLKMKQIENAITESAKKHIGKIKLITMSHNNIFTSKRQSQYNSILLKYQRELELTTNESNIWMNYAHKLGLLKEKLRKSKHNIEKQNTEKLSSQITSSFFRNDTKKMYDIIKREVVHKSAARGIKALADKRGKIHSETDKN